ncbi:MAG: GFA family protein [Sphingomonadales bacterium]|nr:GFA family protein [Sphingomonadales bacterium]
MDRLTCHCGQVSVTPARRPEYINACNCSLCRKSGAWWAYFHPDEVAVAGETAGYCRADKPEPNAEVRFCPRCGATTHFVLTAAAVAKHGNTMLGVNMALADERDLAGLELRYPDGQAWQGEGAFGYVKAAWRL